MISLRSAPARFLANGWLAKLRSRTGWTHGRSVAQSAAVTRCTVARMSGARTAVLASISLASSWGRKPASRAHSPT